MTRRRGRPLFARFYTRVSPVLEREGVARERDRLLAGLSGRVIEVGAGSGLNFPHYPAAVRSVLAVEPEPYLREVARRSAEAAPVPVEVVEGVADRLPAGDGTFDAAIASLVLCSVPDPQAALREMRRVLRPGGQLRFLEHVAADTPGLRRAQRVVDATIWPLFFGGCHTGRDTVSAIETAGFRVEWVERFRLPEAGPPQPTSPHVRGVAVR